MPTVGPELPPHLAKRKRSLDDEVNGSSSPPAKIRAATPPSFGPSSQGQILGPAGPPPQEKRILGPTAPPRTDNTIIGVAPQHTEKRVLGPAPPPAPLSERPSLPPNSTDTDASESDDDYGPSLPPPPGSAAAFTEQTQRETAASAITARKQTAKPKREEWMLIPPTDSDWSSRVDPTKLKNRKFASGKGAKAPTAKSGISAIWTETPEEKRQRLEDEVMGRKEVSTSSTGGNKGKGILEDKEAVATARRIREYDEKNRAKSLYDEHKGQTPREKEDDPSKRGFDKEKDMGLGGRIGHVQKKDMLKRAGDFGSRFERGSYL